MKKKWNMRRRILLSCAGLLWCALFALALFCLNARAAGVEQWAEAERSAGTGAERRTDAEANVTAGAAKRRAEAEADVAADAEMMEAEPAADMEAVDYRVYFVDGDDYNTKIFHTQTGTVPEGTAFTVTYPDQIIGSDGYFWKAVLKSPQSFTAYQAGTHKYYIEYRQDGQAVKPEDPDREGKERLEYWLGKSWAADCEITGQSPDGVRDPFLVVGNDAENNSRLKSLVSKISDAGWHYFYMIGKDYTPQTLAIGTGFDAVYSSVQEETFTAGNSRYRVLRIGVQRKWDPENCLHTWELLTRVSNDCLIQGEETWQCTRCRTEETVRLPALGHADEDGDSLCDRCGRRVFVQQPGSRITTVLRTDGGPRTISFTCIDLDYKGTGKMLYFSDQILEEAVTGECFTEADYNSSPLRQYFNYGFANDSSLAPALKLIERDDGDGIADAAMPLSQVEYEAYAAAGRISGAGGGYFLRDADTGTEGNMWAVSPDGRLVSEPAASGSCGARMAVLLETPVTGETAEPARWTEGDIQMRRVGKETVRFRCVDEDYSDSKDGRRKAALFLCDSVIGADTGSSGTLKTFSFGENNNYKTSEVRRWLQDNSTDESFGLEPVYTGVNTAYTGSTQAGTREQLSESRLTRHDIGFQLMQDRLFCLSMEEALKYRDVLWSTGGTQPGQYAEGYYLRTPYYAQDDTGAFRYTDDVYGVDLVNGNIHTVKTDSVTYGLRPAFALPQE